MDQPDNSTPLLDECIMTLIPDVVSLALQAGSAIQTIYHDDHHVQYKEDKSPLTEADLASNEVICNGLRSLSVDRDTPAPILSEESKAIPYEERRLWSTFWMVDPLDGTKEFIKKNGEFTVNIALVRDTTPVLGVVYAPEADALYCGSRGYGAWKVEGAAAKASQLLSSEAIREHGRILPCADRENDDKLHVVASRSHQNQATREYIDSLARERGDMALVSAGSSLKFCLLATGTADVYPRFAPTMEWDTAAAHAVLHEAGGSVMRADRQEPLTYNKPDLTNPWFLAEGPHFSRLSQSR